MSVSILPAGHHALTAQNERCYYPFMSAPSKAIVVSLAVLVALSGWAQTETNSTPDSVGRKITHIPDYKPVPGDVYRLVIDFGGDLGIRSSDETAIVTYDMIDRKSTRLNSSHYS